MATAVGFTGDGALTALAFKGQAVAVGFTGAGALAATLVGQYQIPAQFAGAGALTATAYQYATTAAAFTGAGALGAAISQIQNVAAAFTGAGALTLGVTSQVWQPMSTLTDNFATQDNTKWTYMAGASVTGAGGSYARIVPGNAANVTITSNNLFNLTGSSAEVCAFQIAEQGGGTAANVVTQLLIIDPNGYGWSIWENNGTLYFREIASGGTVDTNVAYNATNHKFWRVRESAGTIYWETSPDSQTWTTQRSKAEDPSVLLTMMKAQLLGYWTGSGAPGVILFSQFNLPVPTAFVTAPFTGSGTMSATGKFPATAYVQTIVSASGSYTIPYWANYLDIVPIGGGGGGQSLGLFGGWGLGGNAGAFNAVTIARGNQIAWTLTSLSVTVGGGGPGGPGNTSNNPGSAGGASSCSGTGWAGISGGGGAGGNGTTTNTAGQAAGTGSFNGLSYPGGAGGAASSGAGGIPGGGGGGAQVTDTGGGAGGRGQVWITAYQNPGTPT
jgi:hypothetical protein